MFYYYREKLFNNISWMVNENLPMRISYLYHETDIEKEYKINFHSSEESDILNKILLLFKNYINDMYFADRLSFNFNYLKLSEIDYFILLLRNFLKENELDQQNIFFRKYNIDMYDEELVWSNENGCEDYIYTLTNFSLVYQKLFLLTCTYCESKNNILKIQPYITVFKYSDTIKENLKKGKIDVICR